MLKEGETVEIGDWGSNKQFAQYPLTVEPNLAMLKVATKWKVQERISIRS
jgi:hypothetical protein